jgi:hypothetical protein
MKLNRIISQCAYALAAALALSATGVNAATETINDPATTLAPIQIAEAAPAAAIEIEVKADAVAVTPMQSGVRRAAAQGTTSLRRYVMRTEPIYNYRYADFAKYLPRE